MLPIENARRESFERFASSVIAPRNLKNEETAGESWKGPTRVKSQKLQKSAGSAPPREVCRERASTLLRSLGPRTSSSTGLLCRDPFTGSLSSVAMAVGRDRYLPTLASPLFDSCRVDYTDGG